MTRALPRRGRQSGVTLIEMLVVIALLAVAAGSVVLAIPGQRSATPADLDLLALSARLDAATRRALARGEPFAIWQGDGTFVLLLLNDSDRWVISDNPRLNPVKLISRHPRMTFQRDDKDVFPVSPALVPERGDRLLITAGEGNDAYFDGLGIVQVQAERQNANAVARERIQPD